MVGKVAYQLTNLNYISSAGRFHYLEHLLTATIKNLKIVIELYNLDDISVQLYTFHLFNDGRYKPVNFK
jgi:hypothetical protein